MDLYKNKRIIDSYYEMKHDWKLLVEANVNLMNRIKELEQKLYETNNEGDVKDIQTIEWLGLDELQDSKESNDISSYKEEM